MKLTLYNYVSLAASVASFGSLFWLWQQTATHYDIPRPWVLGVALVQFIQPRSSRLVWLWWGLGLLTILWSLTPGQTLITSQWELVYVATFAAAASLASRGRGAYWFLNLALLGYGLYSALSLNLFGRPMYFSGSLHYIVGAQALLLIPSLFLYLNQKPKWGIFATLALTASLFAALMSGARSVYLPLLLMIILMVVRVWLETKKPLQILGVSVLIGTLVALLDLSISVRPIANILVGKTSLSTQTNDLQTEGSFGSRLQMWQQTLGIAARQPLGTGNGSFRDILAAYQQYPSLLFSNAHNYYLETAATGGWLRLIVLLAMLGGILWRGWRGPAWPWALGAAGLWATLTFDITGMYPAVMMLAFASLGIVYAQLEHRPIGPKSWVLLRFPGLLIGLGLIAWWYWPCPSSCAVTRHLGYRPEVQSQSPQLSENDRDQLLERAIQLNPQSIWIYRMQLQYAQTPNQKLKILRTITQKFPLAGPWFYFQQAELAKELGLNTEAIETLRSGLSRFPIGFRPAWIPLGDRLVKQYEEWSQKAPELLKQLEAQ